MKVKARECLSVDNQLHVYYINIDIGYDRDTHAPKGRITPHLSLCLFWYYNSICYQTYNKPKTLHITNSLKHAINGSTYFCVLGHHGLRRLRNVTSFNVNSLRTRSSAVLLRARFLVHNKLSQLVQKL